jgi:purine-cytosine permease-like protein
MTINATSSLEATDDGGEDGLPNRHSRPLRDHPGYPPHAVIGHMEVAPVGLCAEETGEPSVNSGFERHGIESIPDRDRTATIFDFLRIAWSGSNSLPTAVLGAFPIIFGLSFWQSVAATVLGVVVGAIILAPMAIFGPLSGTNNAVSSSAHFGVVGRIVGSFLSLLTAVAFFSISVWSSGDAVVGAARQLFAMRESNFAFATAYATFALAVLVVSIYGFRLMLFVTKIAVVAASALFVVGFYAFYPAFDAHFAGAGLAWGEPRFWAAFVGSSLVVLANPISYGAFLGDWTRYLPRNTDRRRLMVASIVAQLLTLGPFLFGLVTTSIIARLAPQYLDQVDYTGGLLAIAPHGFFLPLFALAVSSGMSTGVTALYGTGLDFSSVFPQLTRPQATLLIGSIACVLIFVGRFGFNLVDAITTFISLIVVTTTPWMVVMIIGYFVRRGYYLPEAMQVFNRGQEGGPYWFVGGWNVAGMTAWLVSAALALLMVNMPGHFVGALGNIAGGVDVSLLAALCLPAVLYPALLYVFPEPRAVFGPSGPRGTRAVDVPLAPIVTRRRRWSETGAREIP